MNLIIRAIKKLILELIDKHKALKNDQSAMIEDFSEQVKELSIYQIIEVRKAFIVLKVSLLIGIVNLIQAK